MDSAMIRALVEVESGAASDGSRVPTAPEKAVSRTYPGAPQKDDSIELQRLTHHDQTPSRPSTPRARDDDLEMSRPATPVADGDGVEALQSVWDPFMNRFRLAAACLMNFLNGLNDSAPGALIPYMEAHYKIGYAVVSLIFVGNAMGFIIGAAFMDTLRMHLGRAKILTLSQAVIAVAYIPILCGAPFAAIIPCFFLVGFGMSINLAMGNIFCGSLRDGTTHLGLMHGCYGIGGTIGPLIATAIVTVANAPWNRYYFLTFGLAVFSVGFATWSFWSYEAESPAALLEADRPDGNSQLLGMFHALKGRLVLLGAIFIFAYQGAEVSISGWVISFLIAARNGDPSSVGYVTSGFWAGITVGRFLLSTPAHKVGEKLFVYFAIVGAAVFEVLVWWIPHVVGDAISVAIVGLLLGPIYPCAAAVFMRGMSRTEKVSGMGVISAFGSSGGAIAPFTTGILAQAVGPWALHPIAISLCAVMLIGWYALPVTRKRTE